MLYTLLWPNNFIIWMDFVSIIKFVYGKTSFYECVGYEI